MYEQRQDGSSPTIAIYIKVYQSVRLCVARAGQPTQVEFTLVSQGFSVCDESKRGMKNLIH